MIAANLKRVRRRLQRLRCERRCARDDNALAEQSGLIVTTFYDVEGDYARHGQTPVEIAALDRILEIERRHGIRSTYNVVGRFALDAPEIIGAIARDGHEIASHSYDHSILTGLGRASIADNLRRTKHALQTLGITAIGHRSPQSDWDDRVLDALATTGYAWSAENGAEPYPYRIRRAAPSATVWRFPVADDDWSYEADRATPAAMVERWKARVQAAQSAGRPHLALGFHAWVEAAHDRLTALEEFFRWLVERNGVRVLPFGDVLALMQRSAAGYRAAAHG